MNARINALIARHATGAYVLAGGVCLLSALAVALLTSAYGQTWIALAPASITALAADVIRRAANALDRQHGRRGGA